MIHEIRSEDSALRSNLMKKITTANKTLREISAKNEVPEKILSSYSIIKAKYQNRIYKHEALIGKVLPLDITYDSVLSKLELLCDFYSWDVEESSGQKPMYKSRNSLKYYAVLMSNWMNSTPLNRMISTSIKYYTDIGEIWDVDKLVTFNAKSKYHINLVINEIISNIDNILRFKLKNYFGNYYALLVEKLGEKEAGMDWSEFLEYGTSDMRIIELQNISIPRHLASFLLENYSEFFTFEKNILTSVNKSDLLAKMDSKSIEFKELIEIL